MMDTAAVEHNALATSSLVFPVLMRGTRLTKAASGAESRKVRAYLAAEMWNASEPSRVLTRAAAIVSRVTQQAPNICSNRHFSKLI